MEVVEDNPALTITHIQSYLTYSSFNVTIHHHHVRTIVTSQPSVVHAWIDIIHRMQYGRILNGSLVVGLGVQWSPNINPGAPRNPPATLQLCVGGQCLIYQILLSPPVPDLLRYFLSNPAISFVGVGANNARNLLQNYSGHQLSVSRLIELRRVAHNWRGVPWGASMETLAAEVLGLPGVRKLPWIGLSDWEVDWLNEHQVKYASIDAFISFSLGKELRVWHWVQ